MEFLCARMKVSGWEVVKRFVASGRSEQTVVVPPTPAARRECRHRQLSARPLTLRLIRVELENGDVEVLATSLLDRSTYPVSLFKDLQHQRWPVEEQYKVIKCRLEVENFSGTSVLAVYQDFHAKVFTVNLCAQSAAVKHSRFMSGSGSIAAIRPYIWEGWRVSRSW